MTAFARLVAALHEHGVRFVLIGVAGANHWARSGAAIFTTQDYDLLLPLDPDSALASWQDRLFLAAHADALRSFMEEEG